MTEVNPSIARSPQLFQGGYIVKYLLIIGHDDEFGPSPELIGRIVAWNHRMHDRKVLVDSNPLKPWQEAKTIRTKNGQIVVAPGSFSDSREKVSAYVLVNCESEEEALEIACEHPMAKEAVIEVRPVWEDLGKS